MQSIQVKRVAKEELDRDHRREQKYKEKKKIAKNGSYSQSHSL